MSEVGRTLTDSNRLAYSGRADAPAVTSARARRWGWWFYAEHFLRSSKAYAWSILGYSVGQPLLYFLSLGLGLGSLVDQGVGTVDGVPYLTFVGPAILVSTVVMGASGEMTYPVMGGFKWQRLYYAPISAPVSPAQVATGHFVAVMIRFVLQATVIWLMLLAFGATTSPWSWLTIPVGVLAAGAFGAPLQAYAATLLDEGAQFAFVQRFIVMPMFLFAGTFFPLSAMPAWLQWIGWVSPIWHGTQLARLVSYGAAVSGWLAAVHVAYLGGLLALGVVLSRRRYERRLIA